MYFENSQRDALARETKTSKSTVGTLSESKYRRGKRRQGLQVGTGLHFPRWAFSRQFCRIPVAPGMDNKRFVVCFRDGVLVDVLLLVDMTRFSPLKRQTCSKGHLYQVQTSVQYEYKPKRLML
ncbi:hypothetical protein CDAR_48761 [Caerostris darwini]|uniref:Uncharacterized protein n=1 Tax=Caerostris darwini TaxID=1538125 RepID=A0AAV4NHP4_9ARAC|nr:hypothetical protein CDAR_48761 [Caerostris darwini]